MGRKHSRQRQHVFLYIACWLSLSFVCAGCTFLHIPGEEETLVLQAKSSFAKSDFTKSMTYWREILERFPDTRGDQALYAMGLAYAFPKYPDANYKTSLNFFKMLIREYPESVYINQAKIWIHILDSSIKKQEDMDQKNKKIESLENELKVQDKKIKGLLNQIESLKEVDLGIEEKKRKILPENGN
jgi:hypothetical protein